MALFDLIKRKKKTLAGNLDFKKLDQDEAGGDELTVSDEQTGDVGLSSTSGYCQNCHAPLGGKFCGECGQVDKELRRPFWFLLWDLGDDILSWDSRILKTLGPLLFLPGLLTRTFMDGKRARYVPPIRLYIISSIFFFLVVTITNVAIVKFVVREVPPEIAQESATFQARETIAARKLALEEDGLTEAEQKELTQLESALTSLEPENSTARPQSSIGQGQNLEDVKAQQKEWLQKQVEDLAKAFGDGLIPTRERYRELLDELIKDNIETSNQVLKVQAIPLETSEADVIVDASDEEGDVDDEGYYVPPQTYVPSPKNRGGVTISSDNDWQIEWFVPMGQVGEAPSLDEDEFQQPIDDLQRQIDEIEVMPVKAFTDNVAVIFMKRVQKAMLGFQTAVQDPEKLNDVLNDWMPRAMIILLPILAILLKFFYWGRANCFVTQLVFSLHFHTYIFLVISFLIIAQYFLGAAAASWMFFAAVPLYMFIGLKYSSSNGWIKTIFKFPIIGIIYLVLFMMVMIFTVMWGLGGL